MAGTEIEYLGSGIGGLSVGVTYSGITMFWARMRCALSLPHTLVCCVPVGTTICRTPTKCVPEESVGSLVTRSSPTGRSLPNVDVAQSMSLGPDRAVTQ